MTNGAYASYKVRKYKVHKVESSGLNSACVLNEDGSYDIEMVIEFFPQRWFYLGLLISPRKIALLSRGKPRKIAALSCGKKLNK